MPKRSTPRPRRPARARGQTRRPATRRARGTSRRAASSFAKLVDIMAVLRSPSGCPWDVKQTHDSLRPYLVEETYEALDALDRHDLEALPGELGDVLFQCVFHGRIAEEAGRFDIVTVIDAIAQKLIARHPHVFARDGRPLSPRERRATGVDTPRAVRDQWSQIKARERQQAGTAPGLLASVPRALPALMRAYTIGSRVATVGFDWPEASTVIDKIDEEVRELRVALQTGHAESLDEFGDLLFSIANLSRKLGLNPEEALRHANDKFTRRFEGIEAKVAASGRQVAQVPLDQLEAFWAEVKREEQTPPPSSPAHSRSARAARDRRSRG